MRYTAPEHTTDAFISSGQVLVDEDGILDVPDVTEGDHAGLIHSGFVPVVEGAPAAKPVAKLAAPTATAAPISVSEA